MLRDKLSIKLSELLSALSLALDSANNRIFQHSRRTAYVAFNIAKNMGIDEHILSDIYYASFIHDIGMTGEMTQYSIEDIHNDKKLKKEHCQAGAEIIKYLPLNERVHDFVLYHHEEWNGKGVYGLKHDDIPIGSQIIHLADYFDLNYGSILNEDINVNNIKRFFIIAKGELFSPEAVDSFLDVMDKEKFWFDLKFYNFQQILNTIEPNKQREINIGELKKIAKAFSVLIDKKSKFTYTHSQGVAKITKDIAEYFDYDKLVVDKLEIAAYLHDLGKLVVPNEILEKPGKLSKEEFDIIKSHPYYTKIILKQVKGLEIIADWAGNHHEKLDGTGYPEKLTNNNLTREDQIIAIADIYQALTEDRPYRKGLSKEEALKIIQDIGSKNKFQQEVINGLREVI
ncbi:HD-GYP domain-containing protein [Caldisalinibacter kiritimatiensis]|uniref:Putative metal-dependent phosphohydrolase n=1 Tax=Caldisalinibacter kiritimatiensis TaxID=1304284 RepID=R1ASB9_9FIRM|nr:HD domain-containing phosphohydrolase [Caldisalinibacter kiritimatiensis]EOD00023.1 Putative metal-dependent phosphohydrolase [Caldisalinibacter kiritimatiensis]